MDRKTKNEIMEIVRSAMADTNDRLVTADELCKHIGCFTKRWLKDNGKLLDRVQPTWKDADGRIHKMPFVYPLNKTMELVKSGAIIGVRTNN